jgi:histidinol dehydrogenase
MTVVPAQVAGVRRIIVCTPPSGAGLIAAAAEALGVGEVWALGGPQAIAFLAYVERVDKIVGPGNAYVNEAKLEVSRDVPIDLPGGPSEVVVLATGDYDPRLVELELAAQGEHGADAVCRTVTTLAEAEEIAPEHLGPWSPVPSGDYATGGNHVLPTGGWARSVGGLGLETFLKPITTQRLTEAGLARVRPTVEALAAVEGMPAHAAAVRR